NTTGQSKVIYNANVLSTSLASPVTLSVGHTYTWWVRAWLSNTAPGFWSDALSFAVVQLPAPGLTGPLGQQLTAKPTFTWTAVPRADHYDLWVDDATTGQSQVVRNTAIFGTSFVPASPLATGDVYRLWVRAVNSSGTPGLWSAPLV